MDKLTEEKKSYLFVVNFEFNDSLILPLDSFPENILFEIDGVKNFKQKKINEETINLEKEPPDFSKYKNSFEYVKENLNKGNSYLVNLTWLTNVKLNCELKDVFYKSKALFKLYFKDKFIVFSPERFVRIKDDRIDSFPMKGTIDASIPDAKHKILNNKKEQAEHATIVDLIRNDLSMVAKNVSVPQYRFISEVFTNNKNLLQVSSRITGEILPEYSKKYGTLLSKILPAGSISGAPKKKTVEIIKEAEPDNRGFYTGVFGVFDGETLDSAVMIRFIEKTKDGFIYRSGGGITSQSDCSEEYNELLDKIYVPVY